MSDLTEHRKFKWAWIFQPSYFIPNLNQMSSQLSEAIYVVRELRVFLSNISRGSIQLFQKARTQALNSVDRSGSTSWLAPGLDTKSLYDLRKTCQGSLSLTSYSGKGKDYSHFWCLLDRWEHGREGFLQ